MTDEELTVQIKLRASIALLSSINHYEDIRDIISKLESMRCNNKIENILEDRQK